MKKYIVFITSLGLWAGLLPATEAQDNSATVTALPTAQESPDLPGQPGYSLGFAVPQTGSTTSWWREDARDSEGAASVLTFKAPDQKTVDETAEDLNILSLIFSRHLERALGEEGGERGEFKLGIPMLLQTGGRWVDASYVEGFGAVFSLKVRFPLVPAAAANKNTQNGQQDSEWEQARRALARGATDSDARRQNPYERARRYNPNLVETLKKRVLELLKNASNLRHVQSDEWVVVTFAGPPNVAPRPAGAMAGMGSVSIDGNVGTEAVPEQPAANPATTSSPVGSQSPFTGSSTGAMAGQQAAPQSPARATIMTIRVKKRDADAFAANKMSEDQFFHAAEIASYLGPVIVNRAASDYLLLTK
jgi:hypothetical protein